MSRKILIPVFIFILLVSFISVSHAWSDWRTYKTKHFTVFYKPGLEDKAWKILQSLEYYRTKVESLAGNTCLNTNIIVQDVGNLVNGYTEPALNRIELNIKSPSEGQLQLNQDWFSTLTVHEYTHMAEISNVSGLFKILTDVFGPALYPNAIFPLWGLEGIAVYSESNYSPYSGRLNDGFFDAYVMSRAKEGDFPSIEEATFMPVDYPWHGGAYMYGSEFYRFLSQKYGQDSLTKFFKYYGGSIPVLQIGTTARAAFGKNFPHLWEDWKEYEKEKAKNFKVDGDRFTQHGWIIKNPVIESGKLYFSRGYPVKTAAFTSYWFSQIIEKDLDTGQEKVIASSAPYRGILSKVMIGDLLKIKNGMLYYSEEDKMPGFSNESLGGKGFVNKIHAKDLKTGKTSVLFEDDIRDLEVLEDGNIIYSKDREDPFGSQLIVFDRKTLKNSVLMQTDLLIDRMIAKSGDLYVCARKDLENFGIYKIGLDSKKISEIVQTPYFEGGHSLNGNNLFFSSNYGGKYNLYSYNIGSQIISKVSSGGYEEHPVYDEKNNKLYFIGVTGDGYDIFKKNMESFKFVPPMAVREDKADLTLKKEDVKQGDYSDNINSLFPPYTRIPMLLFDGSSAQSGLFFTGQDAIGNFPYKALALYDSGKKKMVLSTSVQTNFFSPAIASIGYADDTTSQISGQVVYPLIDKIAMGLSSFDLGLYGSSFDNYSRKMVEPFLSAGFNLPNTIFNVSSGIMFERLRLGSSISRTGYIGRLDISAFFLHNGLDASAVAIYDPDNPSDVFPQIRGYQAALTDKSGMILSAEINRRLLKIRQGWWSKGLYFEDLCGLVFIDGASSTAGNSQLSAGAELHLEMKSIVNVDLGLRYSYNKENQSGWAALIKVYLPFNIDMDGKRPVSDRLISRNRF
ncbi:MAG: hypothetical protein NTZ10_06850 [Candidatus Saganbacteria bacterium]|nr:hypothetical protein [Candidatus Saganbacteria bacterium]